MRVDVRIVKTDNPLLRFRVALKPGGLFTEPENQPGVSYLTNAYFSSCSRSMGEREFSEVAEAEQVKFGLADDLTRTEFAAAFLKEKVESALRLWEDLLANRSVRAKDFLRVKERVLALHRSLQEDPNYLLSREVGRALFPDTYLSKTVFGESDFVAGAEPGHLLERWESLLETPAVVAVGLGDWDEKLLERFVEAFRAPESTEPDPRLPSLPPRSTFRRVKFSSPQVFYVLAHPGVPRQKERPFLAQRLASVILSDPEFGRLYEVLREKKGLVYSVSTKATGLLEFDTPSFVQHSLFVEKDLFEKTRNLLHSELKKFSEKGPTKRELELAKRRMAVSLLAFEENPLNRTKIAVAEAIYGLPPDFLQQKVEEMRTLQREEVRDAFAEGFLEGPLYEVVVGDV